jgi:hypothetical protein
LKKLLASIALLGALAATPAAAWDFTSKNYFVQNHAQGTFLVVTGVTLEGHWFPVRTTLPGETSGWTWSAPFPAGCMVTVTISQWFGKPITSPTKMDACTQSTITLTPKAPGPVTDLYFQFH